MKETFKIVPSTGYASDFDDDFGSEFEPETPEAPEVDADDMQPPFDISGVNLLSPPGFVGKVTNWIDSQCRYPRRRLAVASAIVSIGNIGGLRHEDARDGVTANMLAFCVAASATGKEAVQQAAAQLHIAAGMARSLQGGIKSEQEIMRNILDNQAALYIVDEIGVLLTKITNAQRRGGAAYLEGVFGAIMSTYSKANSRLLLNGDVRRELRKEYSQRLSRAQDNADPAAEASALRMLKCVDEGLERPFLSVMGFTTPSTFDAIMNGETATQGFVGRAIIVNEKDINPAPRIGFKKPPMPDALATRLMQIFAGGNFDMLERDRVEWVGEREIVTTTPEADKMLDQISAWLLAYADFNGEHAGEAAVAMIRRAFELVAKISFILALADGVRNEDHVRWAFAYVRHEVDAKIKLVFANDNAKTRPDESVAARILNVLDAEKGVSISVISNRLKASLDVVSATLGKLEGQSLAVERQSKRKYRGEFVRLWYSTS